MFAAPSRQAAPLVVARPDRASFLVAAPDAVLEVDGLGASPALLGRLPCGGRVVQLGVSVSTETGKAALAVALDSGLVEVWDLSRGGGAGGLLQVVPLPNQQKLLKAATAKDGQPCRCLLAGAPAAEPLFFLSVVAPAGSAASVPTVHILSASGDGVGVQTQRLDAVDASRKKTHAVALACHGSRPLLSVCFADGVLHLGAGALASGEGMGGAQLQGLEEAGEHEGEGDGEEDEAASEAGYDEGEEDGANASVKMTKAQRQLLLVPIAALKLGAGLQGAPSCLAFSPGPDFLLAGTTGGQLAVWSISRALHKVSPPQHQASSKMTLAKLMREDNAAPPLFYCDIPARASTGGVAVAAAEFVGGGSPFVLAAVRDAVARSRRSSASRLQERRRSRGSLAMGDDDDDDDGGSMGGGRGAVDSKQAEEPVQYKAARLVVLAVGAEGLAVLGTSQPVAEPVRMALSSGHQGHLLVAGGAAGAAFPPMRLVAVPEVTGFPILGPVPGAIAPTPPSTSWSAFLSPPTGVASPALMALSLQHRLQASLPGAGGPALVFKSMVMAQPLHGLQRLRPDGASGAAARGASSAAAATAGAEAWGFLLPSTLGELTAALPSCAAQLQQLQHLGSSALLWPHRIEVRAGLGIVACRVLGPLDQPFALLPQQQPQQREQDGRAGAPTVVLVVRCSPASGDDAPSPSPLLYAAAGRDAAFSSDATVAVLSLDGRQVVDVQLGEGQQERTARPVLTGVEPAAHRAFSTTEPGALLLAQGLENGCTRLVVTGATAAAPGTGGQPLHVVDLQEGETVREAAWQTGLLEHGGGSTPAPVSVLGLLTSQRVLLLAQDLTLLAAVPLVSSPPAHHLLWLGPALLLASAGGPVAYVDIDARSGAPSLRPLCALDHRHAGARLLAALPDRLVYAARVGAAGGTQVLSRPLMPLEPLVVGALPVLPRLMQSAPELEVQARVGAVVRAVVGRYGPAWLEQASSPVYGAGEGPGANAGVTGVVCMALARAGFVELAAGLAGVGAERSSYPKRPWVPAAVKAGLAAGPSGQQWMAALSEALSDDPAAREYALNPTALSSAALPPRHRRLSHVLAALAAGARRAGHAEAALRLLDAAGEDDAVVSLLLLHLVGQGPGPASEDRAGLLRELFALKADPHTLALAEALWPDWRGAEPNSTTGGGSEAVTAALVGAKLASQAFPTAVQRRSALLPSLPVGRELPSWRQQAVVGNAGTAAATPGSVSKGPPRVGLLRRLLLDRAEEWLGRGAPEGLSDDEEDAGHGGEGSGVATGAAAGEGEAGSSTALWVKGVGQGREDEDNMVLYYRFGEMASVGPPSSSSSPPSFQGDISPYGHALEVLGAVGFEPSTCPMDPGDEGKVHPAMDAVWRGADGGNGLRFCVPRGSALDVGPYHASGPRTKLTVELWTQRPEGAAGAGYEVLLRRRTSEDGQPAAALWSFGVAADGALALWTGDEAAASESTGTLIRTAAGTIPDGRWTHVAFTLEAKGKGSAEVALFVGGKPATTSPPLRVPALAEARLRGTVLEVGPNLAAGNRLTELRVWALLRHADDLYDNRESYLKLAEKRKRLAFKIKGGGVTPPLGEEAAASTSIVAAPALLGRSPPPTTGGALGMAPPPPASFAAARRRGLTPPPGAPAATKTAEGLQAPPALLPAPSVRRPPSARRASPTQGTEAATTAATAARGADTPPASASIPASPSSSAATPPPPAVAGGWASDFESWGEGPSSSSTAATPPPAPPPAPAPAPAPAPIAAPPQAQAQLVVRPGDLGVEAAHVLRDPMLAPAFSPHGYFLCFRERSPTTAPQSAIVVLALSGPGAPRRMRYPFQADSAILVEGPGDAAETAPLIACATSGRGEAAGGGGGGGGAGGALSVYDLTQRKGVARQPASTQIVHWRWLAPRQLALVTARAVFNWYLPAAGASPPAKLFERRDGAARRVRAYHEAGGFGLLLSDDTEQEGGVVAQLFDRERAHLYLEAGGGLVGAGIGRCGCAESPLWLVAVRRDADGAAVRLELYDLAGRDAGGSEAGGASGEPRPLLASLPKRAEVTLPAPAVGTPPVWVFFPKDGTAGRGAVNVVFGGGGQGGLLASWRPPSGVGRGGGGGEVTVAHPLVPAAGAVVCDACVDARGDLLVLQEGDLSVWRAALQ